MWNYTLNNHIKVPFSRLDRRKLPKTLLVNSVLLTLLLAGTYLSDINIIQHLNLKVTDVIIGATKVPRSDVDVVIVTIDDRSLKKYGQWPWPRGQVAELLDTIQKTGAASIGVDILFPEQDRNQTTPNNSISLYDKSLAATLTKGPFILGYQFLFDNAETTTPECELHPLSLLHNQKTNSPTPPLVFHQAIGVVCNNKELSRTTTLSGFFNGAPDLDGIMRRLPLLIEYQGTLYPSFALTIFLKYQNKQSYILRANSGHIPNISSTNLHLPIDNHGQFLLGPTKHPKADYLSAIDVLEKRVLPSKLKGKIVLVGLTASGLGQMYQTPSSPVTPLLDLHKQFIEALGAEVHTIRGPFFPVYEAIISLLLAIVLVAIVSYLPVIVAIGTCLFTVLATVFVTGGIYQFTGYLFSPLLPAFAIVCNCVLLNLYRFKYLHDQAESESEETMQLLETSETNLQSVLNTIPDIVFRLDENSKLTFISPAISKYLKEPDRLLGRPIFDLVAPEDIEKVKYKLNERRTGRRATFDLDARLLLSKLNGDSQQTNRYFNISAEGIYKNDDPSPGNFIGTQGIVRDITRRRRLEEQLLQAQKMEVIGNLAAGVAHDLNNILSGLVSYPDLLLLEIPKDDPMHDKIALIQQSGKKAAVIVQDLLTLARRNVIISEVCNINTIISDYLASFEFQHLDGRYPNISLKTNLQPGLLNIKGSAAHLSKVIMNILHNALEAMPAGGVITIETHSIYLDRYLNGYERIPEGEYSCLSIADKGIGISEIDLKRIFEPFYTNKSMTGNSTGGTGLGMTVIWASIKDHNGFIDIQSREGHGTTVTLYLPITRETADDQQHQTVLDDYIGSETILVVDDIQEQLKIASSMLQKLGYTVLTVTSGEEALELIKTNPVDLVVLDMIMPGGMDGLETYEEILKITPGQKAIIASGFSESDRVKQLQQLGIRNYVQKPYSMETLGTSIRQELAPATIP